MMEYRVVIPYTNVNWPSKSDSKVRLEDLTNTYTNKKKPISS